MLSAAKWGAIVGAAIYIVSQVITLAGQVALGTAPADPAHPGKIALGCLDLLLIIFAFSTSGFYTGRETRQAGYGAIAGMVTFAVYGALLALVPLGARTTFLAGGGTIGQQALVDLFTIILYLGLAALIGWLGGRPGASRGRAAEKRAAPANE